MSDRRGYLRTWRPADNRAKLVPADSAVEQLVLNTVRAASRIVLDRVPVNQVLARQPARLVSVALWALAHQRWLVVLMLALATTGFVCVAGQISLMHPAAF